MRNSTAISLRRFLPKSRHGIIIDLIMIAANLTLFPFLAARMTRLFNDSFGNVRPRFQVMAGLMLVLITGRLAGLYLKRFSLHAKTTPEADTALPLKFIIFSIPVLIVSAAFATIVFLNILGNLGIAQVKEAGSSTDSEAVTYLAVFTILGLVVLEIYLLFRLTRPLTLIERMMAQKGQWIYGRWGELAADFGLFIYMVIWQLFYFYVAELFLTPPPGSVETLNLKFGGLFFTIFAFLLFYVSPRTVFLIEDGKYPSTWLFIAGVYFASIVRYL